MVQEYYLKKKNRVDRFINTYLATADQYRKQKAVNKQSLR